MKKTKKRRRIWVILAGVLLVFAIGIGILLWNQWNNLKALQYASYSSEERQMLLEQNQEAVDAMMESLSVGPLTPLTEEQEAMLQRGEITEKEALQIIMGSKTTGTNQGTLTLAPKKSESQPAGDGSKLQELLARVYLMRSSYTGQLDGLVAQAKNEYIAQKRANGTANKTSIATKYISKGLALEGACDGQMEALLAEISAELTRTGGDTSIVGRIRSTYQTEKSVKKANLLSMYAH